ncbi:hypothetical protein [Mesorhizobium sp. ANAO-SY3R2]|uniref:hypothetical protein n=1 Tax=Mesorhizobium sp. ANAO-SY3R2 TaxID=3166644 RepID=UPI003671973B
MPTLIDAYADMFRIAMFQTDHSTSGTGRWTDRRQLEPPQRRWPNHPGKRSWLA